MEIDRRYGGVPQREFDYDAQRRNLALEIERAIEQDTGDKVRIIDPYYFVNPPERTNYPPPTLTSESPPAPPEESLVAPSPWSEPAWTPEEQQRRERPFVDAAPRWKDPHTAYALRELMPHPQWQQSPSLGASMPSSDTVTADVELTAGRVPRPPQRNQMWPGVQFDPRYNASVYNPTRQAYEGSTGGPPAEPPGWWITPLADRYTTEAEQQKQHVLNAYPFTPEAKRWAQSNVNLNLRTPLPGGGGSSFRNTGQIMTYGPQDEATLHETAHVWFQTTLGRQRNVARDFVDTAYYLALQPDENYPVISKLLREFMLPTEENGGWPIMKSKGLRSSDQPYGYNATEMFAGLASGTMGDMRLMPPELRPYYDTLFVNPYTLRR